MAKGKYVASNVIDNIDGKVIKAGDPVVMDDAAAEPFVKSGALVPAAVAKEEQKKSDESKG